MRLVFAVLAVAALIGGAAGPLLALDLVYNYAMSFDPGWTATGDWQWGEPSGTGGNPSSGYTGPYVYGYNLAGGYPNNMSAQTLTTTAIDCTGLRNTTLRFRRWLGVESNWFDHASVQVSSNGATWTTVWQNPDTSFQDVAWVLVEYDISAVADGQSTVYLRWVMGSTDSSVTYSGWNIDDVQIWADTVDVPLQILAWVPYTDLAWEYGNTLAALSMHFDHYVVTESWTDSAAVLESELAGKHVFLVPEPENTDSATLEAMGTEFSSVLQDFVEAGGTVVVLCEWSGRQGFLTATGLMSASYAARYWMGPLPVVLASHPLAEGLGATVAAQDATAAYTIGPEATSIIEDGYGNTVLACRDIGYGAVVLMGYDFYAYDSDAGQVLANAVRYPRSTVDVLVYEAWNHVHVAREAVSRLGYGYTLADSATFDSALVSQDWDVVVVDAPSSIPADGWAELIGHVKSGGRVALSTWDVTYHPDLCSAFGVSAVQTLAAVPPIYRWDASHALFTTPRSVPDLTTWADRWGSDADRLEPAVAGAVAVAGFSAGPTEEQAALVIGNGANTIINGFLWDDANQDDDADGVSDCVELVMNQVLFLLRRPDVDFSADPLECVVGDGVDFSDLSSAGCTAWAWDFGDGGVSPQRNPTHLYWAPGYRTVTLSATNDWATATAAKHWYIAVGFPDTPPDHWAFHYILSCVMAEIVAGYPDGTYGPGSVVDRAQMAVFIARAMAGGDANVPNPPPGQDPTFPDVPEDYWAYRWIEYLAAEGIVGGYWDGYHPEEEVSRAQMAVFVARGMEGGDANVPEPPPGQDPTFPDVPEDYWAYRWIEHLAAEGVVGGYWDGYRPEELVSRDQMSVFVQRAFELPMKQP